jgi:hypothetical protein
MKVAGFICLALLVAPFAAYAGKVAYVAALNRIRR